MNNVRLIMRREFDDIPDDLVTEYRQKLQDAAQWLATECVKRNISSVEHCQVQDLDRMRPPTQGVKR